MAILNNNPLVGASGNQGGYNINNSLRFRSSASAYLNRTLTTPTNNKIWTYSAWVKRGTIASSSQQHFFNYWTGGTGQSGILFSATTDTIEFFDYTGSYGYQLVTTQVFRDPSAWYHIVVVMDTTQATSSNRIKMYVNGTQITAFSTSTYPSLNYNTLINSANAHYIGRRGDAAGYFDGYIAEQNFIDGQALTPSSFGETDTTTGVWKPKAYSGTYGTNGFYLKFSDIATTSGSNAGLGKDFSGNSNYWTTNNISVTAGTTYDAMTDSPTLTSATVGNYAVLNPLNLASSGVTSSNANLLITSTGAAYRSLTSTIDLPTGSWYFEITAGASSAGDNVMVGIQSVTENLQSNYVGSSATSYGYGSGGNKYNAGTGVAYGVTWTSGDVIGIAFNGSTLTFYKNNTSQGNAYTGLSGNFVFVVSAYNSSASVNFGQRPFSYTPPTGFVRLNTYNLPDSTIKKGNVYMDATLFTATGTTQTITNDGGFQPDLVWQKSRSASGNHFLNDAVRGASKYWNSNVASTGETTNANFLTSFNSNGFSMGSANWANTTTVVGWQWKAGNTSGSSNTNGTRTSTVTTNTTAGFSVLTYTGNSTSGATVGHGLGVAPRMIILKRLANTPDGSPNSIVYHASIGNTGALVLDLTVATQTSSIFWNNTSPTSSVFSVGNDVNVNGTGYTYVAYCWAAIPGFSAFGSYTGNGSTDGPFVYTGFRPKFVMIKCSSAGSTDWFMLDTSRDTYNAEANMLFPNLSNAETNVGAILDGLSNGFKLKIAGGAATNTNGSTYIYMAFAENPFKNSLAR